MASFQNPKLQSPIPLCTQPNEKPDANLFSKRFASAQPASTKHQRNSTAPAVTSEVRWQSNGKQRLKALLLLSLHGLLSAFTVLCCTNWIGRRLCNDASSAGAARQLLPIIYSTSVNGNVIFIASHNVRGGAIDTNKVGCHVWLPCHVLSHSHSHSQAYNMYN